MIDQRHLISGGQPPEVFEGALRRIAAHNLAGMLIVAAVALCVIGVALAFAALAALFRARFVRFIVRSLCLVALPGRGWRAGHSWSPARKACRP